MRMKIKSEKGNGVVAGKYDIVMTGTSMTVSRAKAAQQQVTPRHRLRRKKTPSLLAGGLIQY